MSTLDNDGPRAWQALDRILRWSEHLFVVLVFAPTPGQARALLGRQRFEQARARLSQLGSASSPFDQRIELGLARALRELERLDEAAQHGERAVALGPSAAALREQARIALAQHEVERAATILRQAVSAAEADSLGEQLDVRRELAAALMLGSHWVAARRVLDEALVRAGSEAQLADVCRHDLRVLFDAVIV